MRSQAGSSTGSRRSKASAYKKPTTKRGSDYSSLPGNPTTAKVLKDVLNALSRIPVVQNPNSQAAKNARASTNRAYGMTVAENAAKAGTQRSRMAVDRGRAQASTGQGANRKVAAAKRKAREAKARAANR